MAVSSDVVKPLEHRLANESERELYKQRKQTVEPVFGIIKEVMEFRHFSLRGKRNANLESLLVCVSYTVKRLHRLVQNAMETTKMTP